MALSLRRWLAVTVLGCAAVAVVYLPPRGFDAWPWGDVLTPEYLAARRLGGLLVEEVVALRLLERRDVALSELGSVEVEPGRHEAEDARRNPETMTREAGSRLYADPAVPARLGAALDEVWARATDSLPHGPVRFAAALFLDTVAMWNGIRLNPPRQQADIRYLLPDATDGVTCLTIVTVGPSHRDEALAAEPGAHVAPPASLAELIGPCALVAQLGPPGPAMASWIRVGLYENEAALAARCARGDGDSCHHLLFRHVETAPAMPGAHRFSVRGGSGGFGQRFTPFDAALLRGLADSVGATRFEQLWRASGNAAAAFERAAGIPATRWIQDRISPDDPAAYRQGDQPPRHAVVQGLAAAVACVLLAAAVAGRRQAR